MKFNLKNSSPKSSILFISSFLLLFLAFTSCKKDPIIDPNPPAEIEKKILDFYIPFKNIVIKEAKRQILLYETKDFDDFERLTPEIEISNGVTIKPGSEMSIDAPKPCTHTLTATTGQHDTD